MKFRYLKADNTVCCAGEYADRLCADCQAQHNKEKNMNVNEQAPAPIDLAARIRAARGIDEASVLKSPIIRDAKGLTNVLKNRMKQDESTEAAPPPIDLGARIRATRGAR